MEYLSLYDFLGKPAGKDLGAQVSKRAKQLGIQSQLRQVSTSTYSGDVKLYPKQFLVEYFTPETNEPDDKLPF